jgi:nucleoside-diphosphate-sugar epimerase
MKAIGIVGNGWLGAELRLKFELEGYQTAVFSRNSGLHSNIVTYCLGNLLPSELKNQKKIILCVPPRFRSRSSDESLQEHKDFFDQLSANTYLIYTSSTSVYQQNGVVNEKSSVEGPVSEIERMIIEKFKNHLIFRLGGLAGKNRTIVTHFIKKGVISQANAPSNLLHLSDATRNIIVGIENKYTGIFNLCSPIHPLKGEVYSSWLKKLGLPSLPLKETSEPTKIVSPQAWLDKSQLNFIYENPLDFEFDH